MMMAVDLIVLPLAGRQPELGMGHGQEMTEPDTAEGEGGLWLRREVGRGGYWRVEACSPWR
jgi:hypothetical protein